jgi:heme/copper-type cytochrome/quinol oxidase subunit 3
MKSAISLDVSHLPRAGFGPRALIWWGTMGIIVIESTMFALAIATYFYLRIQYREWPPAGTNPPDLLWGTLTLILLMISGWPMHLVDTAAERGNLRTVKTGLDVVLILSLGLIVTRVFEFRSLNCKWNSSAYGSIVWVVLALHTTHLAAEVVETAVMRFFIAKSPSTKERLDLTVNGLYWYFVLGTWAILYLLIYWAPRWL